MSIIFERRTIFEFGNYEESYIIKNEYRSNRSNRSRVLFFCNDFYQMYLVYTSASKTSRYLSIV